MGVVGLWSDVDKESSELVDICKRHRIKTGQSLRIAIDMSQQLCHIEMNKHGSGYGSEHRTLIRRLCGFVTAGADCVCVFDGELVHEKRQKLVKRNLRYPFVVFARNAARALGMTIVEAPEEAEAQCAELQRTGFVDVVFSNDADVLCNGATRVLTYDNSITTESVGHVSRKSYNRRMILYKVNARERPQFIMRGLLCGNDWDTGVSRLGGTTAARLASEHTDYASRLMQIIRRCRKTGENLQTSKEMDEWRKDIMEEAATNRLKLLSKANKFECLPSFPNTIAVNAFVFPNVSTPPARRKGPPPSPNYEQLLALYTTDTPPVVRLKRQASISDGPRISVEEEFFNTFVPALVSYQLQYAPSTDFVKGLDREWKSLVNGASLRLKPVESTFTLRTQVNSLGIPSEACKKYQAKAIEVPEYLVQSNQLGYFRKALPRKKAGSVQQSALGKRNSTLDQFFSRAEPPQKVAKSKKCSSLPSPPWKADDDTGTVYGDTEPDELDEPDKPTVSKSRLHSEIIYIGDSESDSELEITAVINNRQH